MEKWMDCYSILQVHQNAEADVIESTYKKLSKKYHPDINPSPDAVGRMQDINVAYSILKDEKRRAEYHADWMRRNFPVRAASVDKPASRSGGGANKVPENAEYDKAMDVLAEYFGLLHQGRYQDAYKLLCEDDRRRNSPASFVSWRQSVAQVFDMQTFSIVKDRYFKEFYTGEESVRPAQRFRVIIEERNLLTGQVNKCSNNKFALKDADGWKVFLGYENLTEAAQKFEAMARGTADSVQIVGLCDLESFRKRVEIEAYRSYRYKRPLVLGIFSVDVNYEKQGSGFSECIPALVGEAMGRRIRFTDAVALLEGNRFGIMLAETKLRHAARVLERLCLRFTREAEIQFDASVSIKRTFSEYKDGKPSVQFEDIYSKIGASAGVGM